MTSLGSDSQRFVCSGSLINAKFVMSAAHCFCSIFLACEQEKVARDDDMCKLLLLLLLLQKFLLLLLLIQKLLLLLTFYYDIYCCRFLYGRINWCLIETLSAKLTCVCCFTLSTYFLQLRRHLYLLLQPSNGFEFESPDLDQVTVARVCLAKFNFFQFNLKMIFSSFWATTDFVERQTRSRNFSRLLAKECGSGQRKR